MAADLRRSRGLASWLGVALAASGAAADDRAAGPAADEVPSPSGPPAAPTRAAIEDTLALHVGGRLQLDQYNYLAPGAEEAGLPSSFLLRRFNFELSGRIANRWQFFLQADFAPAGLDAGKNPALKPGAAIVILSHRFTSTLNVQVGQLLTPVTLDHRFPSRERVPLENGLVQQLGAPSPVEIGASVWGQTADQRLGYEIGIFNGDGANRWSPDHRADLIGRIETKPLAATRHRLRGAQLGGSFRLGSRDPAHVTYDAPGLATQGGFRFWRTTYDGASGPTRVIPAGRQRILATDARVPFGRLELMAELVHVRHGTREVAAGEAVAARRTGTLAGSAAYGQLAVWARGSRAALDPARSGGRALQVIARGEVLRARYAGGRRTEPAMAASLDGRIRVNALLLGAKYWWNRYVRGSVNYCIYHFPESGPAIAAPDGSPPGQTARQRAVAPGNTLGPGASEAARASHGLHELLFRLELGF
ncbi:MAG TPA: porin [Kofleriaceae bacterium]|nr:porin [Kofleriaceae bacterium]